MWHLNDAIEHALFQIVSTPPIRSQIDVLYQQREIILS